MWLAIWTSWLAFKIYNSREVCFVPNEIINNVTARANLPHPGKFVYSPLLYPPSFAPFAPQVRFFRVIWAHYVFPSPLFCTISKHGENRRKFISPDDSSALILKSILKIGTIWSISHNFFFVSKTHTKLRKWSPDTNHHKQYNNGKILFLGYQKSRKSGRWKFHFWFFPKSDRWVFVFIFGNTSPFLISLNLKIEPKAFTVMGVPKSGRWVLYRFSEISHLFFLLLIWTLSRMHSL